MEEDVLTGIYNERGFVIRKDKIDVYAAGNHHWHSQEYVKVKDGMGIEEIAKCCTDKIAEMISDPVRWEGLRKDQTTILKDGGIKYVKSLKPKAVAGMTGDFWSDDDRLP